MRGVALWFFASAVIYVTAGMVFGIWMSATHDHGLSPVHAHLNLIGWVTMALFGVYYHMVPAAAESRLATLHFAVATIGLWLIVPGIALAIRGQTELLAALGSFATLGSMVLFLVIVLKTQRPASA